MGWRIVSKPKATGWPAAFRYLPAISKRVQSDASDRQ
jgi:hypothetical protein